MTSPMVDRRFGLVGNAAIKAPVLVIASGDITLSGEQTIDTVAVHAVNASNVPDRVLCVNRSNPVENGIYDVSTSAWSRSPDADGPYDLAKGSTVFVTDGLTFGGSYFQLQTTGPITPGTTAMSWTTVLTVVTQAASSAAAALADANAAHADRVLADADVIAAAASAANALSSANTAYGAIPIYTGVRSTAVAAGVAAVASGALFKTRQQFGQAVDVWNNAAGTGKWQEAVPFGLGEQAARVKAIEGATIADWPAQPDILLDSLDLLTWDGRVFPNSVQLAVSPPTKNLFGSSNTGDIYFGQGGTYTATQRIVGAGGLNTGVEILYAGNNTNVDYIPVINGVTLDPGSYTCSYSGRSKTGFGAQTIQWFESSGSTTQTDSHAEGAYVTKSFTFTVAARAVVNVRLRSTTAGSTFQLDRFFVWENDGNANPGWADETASHHARNIGAVRGLLLNNGLFFDATNSTIATNAIPLAANGLPLTINDLTIFAAVRIPNIASNTVGRIIGTSPIDGASPVGYYLGVGNSNPAAAQTDGSIQGTPTPLTTTNITIRNEQFHVFGSSVSNETIIRGFDGLIHWNLARSAQAGVGTFSRLSFCGYRGGANNDGFKGDISQVAVWINRGVSGAKPFTTTQVQAIMAKMAAHVRARGGSIGSFRDILMAEGDSRNNWLSSDPNGPGWASQISSFEFFGTGTTSLKAPQIGWASSVLGLPTDPSPGTTDFNYVGSSLWSRSAQVLAFISACHAMGIRIFFTWMNDINDTTRLEANYTQYSTDEKVLMQIYRNALDAGGLGSKFFLCTCTPRHTDATFEAIRAPFNTLRRAYPASLVHGIIDLAADATLGTYSGTTAPPGYVDNLHFNKAGSLIAATLAAAAIAPYRLY